MTFSTSRARQHTTMTGRRSPVLQLSRFAWLVLLVTLATFVPLAQAASVMTAQQYFEDANRLFRDNLYWAALLRYQQAADQGFDAAILHYNTGIAHYRAKQHVRARDAFEKALADPTLRTVTQYNLGLNAFAAGNTEEALRWLGPVSNQATSAKLQSFAAAAIAMVRAAAEQPDAFEMRAAEREKKRDLTDLELRVRVSYGNNDNVFRAPNQSYVDFADPTLPLISPEVFSGAYVPVALSAKYRINSLPYEGFYGAYRMSARFHSDETLNNADEYLQELSFGNDYFREDALREREVKSAFTIAQHDEVYYDRDFGEPRVIGGENVSDRMNYIRYGPQLSLRQAFERLSFGARFKGQLWSYEKIENVPEYDHEYFYASVFGQYKLAKTSLFRLTAEYYSRRFGARPAHDLDGRQRPGNPNIRYDYVSLALRARQRIFSSMWFGWDVERTERIDQYVGYSDYTLDSFRFEFHWTPTDRIDVELNAAYRLYDYPNAFPFHREGLGRKTQEAADGSFVATFRLTENLSLFGEAIYRETVSNDTRIQYERNQYLLGVRWQR